MFQYDTKFSNVAHSTVSRIHEVITTKNPFAVGNWERIFTCTIMSTSFWCNLRSSRVSVVAQRTSTIIWNINLYRDSTFRYENIGKYSCPERKSLPSPWMLFRICRKFGNIFTLNTELWNREYPLATLKSRLHLELWTSSFSSSSLRLTVEWATLKILVSSWNKLIREWERKIVGKLRKNFKPATHLKTP